MQYDNPQMTTVVTAGSEQSAGGGALDVWMLILTILGIIVSLAIGGYAVYYAKRSAGYAEKSMTLTQQGLEVQDRQLQLQEEQAAMIPRIEVSDIRFYRPEDSSEFRDVLREVEQNRRKDERDRSAEEERKRKYAEWEQQKKEKEKERENDSLYYRFNPIDKYGISDRNPYEKMTIPMPDPTRYGGYRYDGPKPDAVLDFQIINRGKTAAHDISGTLRLEAFWLQPVNFPAMDDREISDPDEGFFKVDLVRVTELLPGHTVDYRIALQAIHPGSYKKVKVQYEFITPDGVNLKDEKAVEWVHSSPQRG